MRAVGTPVSIGEPFSSAPTPWAVDTEAAGQLWVPRRVSQSPGRGEGVRGAETHLIDWAAEAASQCREELRD